MAVTGYLITAGVVVAGAALLRRKRATGPRQTALGGDSTTGWYPGADTGTNRHDGSETPWTGSAGHGAPDGGGGDGGDSGGGDGGGGD